MRLQITHRAAAVVFRLRLVRIGRQGVTPFFVLRTPRAGLAAFVDPSSHPSVDLITVRGGDEVACPGATSRIRRGRGTVRMRLPRSCLGRPAWVRTRAEVYSFGEFTGHRFTSYADATPGRRISVLRPKSRRAYAPEGALVEDAPPPLGPSLRVPARHLDLLRRLGLLR